jgi:competence protein ComEC
LTIKLQRLISLSILFLFTGLLVSGCYKVERANPSIVPIPDDPFLGKVYSGNMSVDFIGLHGGEATLIRFLDGPTMLVDTGHPDSLSDLMNYLEGEGIETIQYLVLTHFSDEFTGNTAQVVEDLTVENIIVPETTRELIVQPEWDITGEVMEVQAGNTIRVGDAVLTIFAPLSLYLAPQNNALVFQLSHGANQFLFTSGVNEEVELQLLKKYNLASEVLKVSDFGSSNSSAPRFIEEVDAQVAVLFHPGLPVGKPDEVLERLLETWIEVFQTKKGNEYRTVRVLSNGENYEVLLIED